jgi:twinkle protein
MNPKPTRGTQPAKNIVFEYLTKDRKLSPSVIQDFLVAEVMQKKFWYDGKEIICPAVVFPHKAGPNKDGKRSETVMISYLGLDRPDGKKLMMTNKDPRPYLFGWQALDPLTRQVVIREGAINAMSWHQYGIPCLATPFGAGKGDKQSWIDQEWNNLERFEVIFIDFDHDEAGKLATEELVQRLGRHRCLVVPPYPDGHKDTNDCLRTGVSKDAMLDLLAQAESRDPEELRSATLYTEEVVQKFYPNSDEVLGIPMPFEELRRDDRYRTRLGELTIWLGMTGQGKTECLNWVYANLLARNTLCCIASFEMPGPAELARLVRQITGMKKPSENHVRQVMAWFAERLWIYDKVGKANPDSIIEIFTYARRRYGIQHFVLDSMMRCGIREDDYAGQAEFTYRLATLCLDEWMHIDFVVHSRKRDSDRKIIDTQDVKGSGDIANQAHNVFVVSRNKKKEMEAFRDPIAWDAKLRLEKQREGDGWLGEIELWFDSNSKQFLDSNSAQPETLLEEVIVQLQEDSEEPEDDQYEF